MATKKKQPTFEEGLGQLEEIAQKMERSDLPLEELMKLYEDGMALSEELKSKLEGMKASMQEVKQGKDGAPELSKTDVADQLDMADMLGGAQDSTRG